MAAPPICAWNFLDNHTDTSSNGQQATKGKSYADAIGAQATAKAGKDLDVSLLPTPEWQGDVPMIRIPMSGVQKGIERCKLCLVGRLDLRKLVKARMERLIKETWKPKGSVKIVPLGSGYIMWRFTLQEDYDSVWGQGTYIWDKQLLRLNKWTPNFTAQHQNHSNALVWVKFPGLSLEYWEPETLMALGKAVGRPLHIDNTTAQRDTGFYAMVLCDIDVSKLPPEKIWVEVIDTNIKFWQPIEVGKMPKFCSHCKKIGHYVNECTNLQADLEKEKEREEKEKAEAASKKLKKKVRVSVPKEAEVTEVINVEATEKQQDKTHNGEDNNTMVEKEQGQEEEASGSKQVGDKQDEQLEQGDITEPFQDAIEEPIAEEEEINPADAEVTDLAKDSPSRVAPVIEAAITPALRQVSQGGPSSRPPDHLGQLQPQMPTAQLAQQEKPNSEADDILTRWNARQKETESVSQDATAESRSKANTEVDDIMARWKLRQDAEVEAAATANLKKKRESSKELPLASGNVVGIRKKKNTKYDQ